MAFTNNLKRLSVAAAVALGCVLYLTGLTSMGMVGPDEPRYAAIGRAMAQTGDWVTPRLWGMPWFEKPALLYWMIGAGFRAGLGPDLAPRLPVALLSLGFLAFFWLKVRREWDARVASYGTALLATSGGWLVYSHVAITDLPLAAFFGAALLLALPWIKDGTHRGVTASAACLGLAVLAKGLVPLVLFVPVLALGWRRIAAWLRPAPLIAFFICAVPWYVAVTAVNGAEFLRVFFVQHHFERFSSGALQHVQPWWYYGPAALILLFPWFPFLAYCRSRELRDPRLRVLAFVVAFGFVFFSASVNKLPSYLLPLVPAVSILVAIAVSRAERAMGGVIAACVLLGLLPAIAAVVPPALTHGIRSAEIPWREALAGALIGAVAGALIVSVGKRKSVAITIAVAAFSMVWLQIRIFPAVDRAASARPLWEASHPACAPNLARGILYGLYYYSGRELAACAVDPAGNTVVR